MDAEGKKKKEKKTMGHFGLFGPNVKLMMTYALNCRLLR